MTRFRARILGCGSSGGVPRVGGPDGAGDWGVCDPEEPRNHRSRCSILIERRHEAHDFRRDIVTSVLVDTSPDMRRQLLDARCARLDAVMITHDHADQTHGIDDLRAFALQMKRRIPVYLRHDTAPELINRFRYCFEQAPGSWYPAILDARDLPAPGVVTEINGPSGAIPVTSFDQKHGPVTSLGFRIGGLAYSSDVSDLSEESFELLRDLDVWIVDALQMKPHGSHAHLEKTLSWIERVKPNRAFLTNLHNSMDYQTLLKIVPDGVTPAFDGMEVQFD